MCNGRDNCYFFYAFNTEEYMGKIPVSSARNQLTGNVASCKTGAVNT